MKQNNNMIRYELSSLAKVRRTTLPFETSSTNENPQRIETFLGVVECLLKRPNASGLCIKIDAQYYAWIVVEKVVNNDWLLWNSLNKLFCPSLCLEDKISCLRYEKTSSTECNVIPVHRAFKIRSGQEFFTLQNTASPFLAYGMFIGKEVVYFSYPIFVTYPIKQYLHTVRGRPLVLSTRNAAASHDVIYWVRCHDMVLEVRLSKMSYYLQLNSLWRDDQFVYTFGEKGPKCAIQLPPTSLQLTWFWPVFLYPVHQKNINYRYLRDKA